MALRGAMHAVTRELPARGGDGIGQLAPADDDANLAGGCPRGGAQGRDDLFVLKAILKVAHHGKSPA